MNTLFVPFQPDAHGVPLTDAIVRHGSPDDLPSTGALFAHREGSNPDEGAEVHRRRFDDDRQELVVAEHAGEVIGYAWLSWLTPEADGGRHAPDGWYLSGIVVSPGFRRRGLGRRLTQARIDLALERGGCVFYVVSASNLASRRLHASLGFREVTGDFVVPGVVFGNDDGILCRLDHQSDADVLDLDARRASRA